MNLTKTKYFHVAGYETFKLIRRWRKNEKRNPEKEMSWNGRRRKVSDAGVVLARHEAHLDSFFSSLKSPIVRRPSKNEELRELKISILQMPKETICSRQEFQSAKNVNNVSRKKKKCSCHFERIQYYHSQEHFMWL